jgi:hypothetical protein
MLILSNEEYRQLKEKIKQEIIEEMENDKKASFNTIGQKAYKEIFEQYFPKDLLGIQYDNFRRTRIQQALCTANNVLRLRTGVRREYGAERDVRIRNEVELQNAIKTYEELCKAFKELLQEDVYKD